MTSSKGLIATLLGAANQFENPVQVLVGDLAGFAAQQRRHDLGVRPVEEGLDQVLQGRPSGRVSGDRRHVDVAQPLRLVPHVALGFEHAQLRAHGGVAGRARQAVEDLAGRRAAEPIETVHDLALAFREDGVHGCGWHASFITYLLFK